MFLKTRKQKIFLFCGFLILFLIAHFYSPSIARGEELDEEEEKESILDLQGKIREKTDQINEINEKISAYEQEIEKLEGQAITLKGHINILNSQIGKTEDEINLLNNEVQQTELEIKKLGLDINLTQEGIDQKLLEIEAILKEINSLDEDYLGSAEVQTSSIVDIFVHFFKVIIKYSSWSDYEKTAEDTRKINELLKQKRDQLSDLKVELEENRRQAETKNQELNDQKVKLGQKQQLLGEEKQSKREILTQTQANEAKYEDLLEKAAAVQKALNKEVIVLKEEVKLKIARLQEGAQNITAILTWPLPYRRITSYFHDPTYPYRKYFEHNAIDIACPQGTPIHAPAAGYVARTRNAGYGYNYITLIHTETLQTRYGHVSSFAVSEDDFVKAGQIIGYTGGMPGTPGAGYLTTGPHLHFEVRLGSQELDEESGDVYTTWTAVNPLNYLP